MIVTRANWMPLAAALCALPLSVHAQPPDTSNWACRLCPFPTGHEAQYTAGVTVVSDDAARFGNATGLDEAGGYALLDGSGLLVAGERRLEWAVRDLGLDSRRLRLEGGRPGRVGFRVELDELPHRRFDTSSTVFRQRGGSALRLPAGWIRGPATPLLPALGGSLAPRDIASDRRRLALGVQLDALERFDLYAGFSQRVNEGVRIGSLPNFTTAALLPRPFHHETSEIEAGLRYGGSRATFELAYLASLFENRSLELVVDNPFVSVPGAEAGRLARAPDSAFHQVRASGRVATGWHGAAVTYSAAVGRIEQDERLLPYTLNPNLPVGALPRASLDGRVDTRHLDVVLAARPLSRLRMRIGMRSEQRNNRTPVATYNRVIADSFATTAFETNTPYGFERDKISVSGEYRLLPALRIGGAYEYRAVERDLQAVAEQDERIGWGRVRWQAGNNVELAAKLGSSKRDIERMDAGAPVAPGANPLLQRFNLAYRYREFGELRVSAMLPARPVSWGATLSVADDSYSDSVLGLTGGDERRLAADLSWSFSDSATLSFVAARDRIDSRQAGSELGRGPDWSARHADRFDQLGIALRLDSLGERFSLELDYNLTRGATRIRLDSVAAGADELPELESSLDAIGAELVFRRSERLSGRLQLRYERLEVSDWSLQNVEAATIPNVLSLGADPYDYEVVVVGLAVDYRIGG